ncbi:MAG: hypothetical protein AMXMBFR58_34370 [Phycisphaerae bacterium]
MNTHRDPFERPRPDGARRALRSASTVFQQCGLEQLEARRLLFAWSADEVYLLELVNRARANPAAESARLGIDLTEGLTPGQLARLGPQEPLALNEALTVAARLHSQDMADRGFFDHINLDGLNPTDRAIAQGYSYSAGENIAAGYFTIDSLHAAWLESLEHRLNILSLHDDFDDGFKYTEFGAGAGIPTVEGDPYGIYHTQMFGYQGLSTDLFVLGVVYDDADSDSFYTPGEGLSDIRVDVLDSGNAVVGTYFTDAAGNYQIVVLPGTYTLLFTDFETGEIKSVALTVASQNVKVDARSSEFAPPPEDPGGGDGTGGDGTGGDGSGGGGTGGDGSGGGGTGGDGTGGDGTGGDGSGGDGSGGDGTGGDGSGGDGSGGGGSGGDGSGGGDSDGSGSNDNDSDGDGSNNDDGTPHTDEAKSGSVINASSNTGDLLTVTAINEKGLPIVIESLADGTWRYVNLSSAMPGAAAIGNIVTWTDARDGLTYAAVASTKGEYVFKRNATGTWTGLNLSSRIAGSAPIKKGLTQFTSADGTVYLAGLTSGGSLVYLAQKTLGKWTYRNVTLKDLKPNGQATPKFTGELVSFVTAWDALNIAGLDADGNIRAVWLAPGMTNWREDNLSALTGAPPLSGGLTPFLTSWGAINLAGVDQTGDLLATWWVPGGEWQTSNLTAMFSGPKLLGQTISSFVTPWGAMNIAGVDTNGKLSVYWWAPTMTDWAIATLSDEIEGAIPPAGPIRGTTSDAATINLVGASEHGVILRYHWKPGDIWRMDNLTAAV